MNKLNNNILSIFKKYSKKEAFLSLLTGFLFFVFPTVLLLAISVNLMIIYARIYSIMYGVTLIITIYFGIYGSKKVVETLQHYQKHEDMDYDAIYAQISMIMTILILGVYITIFNFL